MSYLYTTAQLTGQNKNRVFGFRKSSLYQQQLTVTTYEVVKANEKIKSTSFPNLGLKSYQSSLEGGSKAVPVTQM